MNLFWSEDAVSSLKEFWNRGWSATQIAAQMRTTRNAVLGKVHRLGLEGRKVVVQLSPEEIAAREERRRLKRNEKESRRRARLMLERPAKPEPPDPVYLGYSLNIPTIDLRSFSSGSPNQCRYIGAEPPGPGYLACGNETSPGASYCQHCKRILFRSDLRPAPTRPAFRAVA